MKHTPIKRKPKGVTPKGLREHIARMRLRFNRETCQRGCVMCANEMIGDQARRDFAADFAKLEAHHVLPKQALKRERGITELDDRMWDPDDGVCLCSYHHQRHEKHVQRLARRLVPAAAVAFAARLDLGWLLDREYPPADEKCDHCGHADATWRGLGWFCPDCEHEMAQ